MVHCRCMTSFNLRARIEVLPNRVIGRLSVQGSLSVGRTRKERHDEFSGLPKAGLASRNASARRRWCVRWRSVCVQRDRRRHSLSSGRAPRRRTVRLSIRCATETCVARSRRWQPIAALLLHLGDETSSSLTTVRHPHSVTWFLFSSHSHVRGPFG
jgi:hypothetical protein